MVLQPFLTFSQKTLDPQVETEEQLAFVNLLHETIASVDVTKKAVSKDKTQTNLRSFLKRPDAISTKKTGF